MKYSDLFWAKVDDSDICWEWLAFRDRDGYGKFKDGSKSYYAHRYSYEQLVGLIPEGLEIDHLCWNRGCVNPEHLEPVTRDENMLRRYAGMEVCGNGHRFDEPNTYIRPNGHRDCRACIRDRARKRRRRRAA